MSEKHLAWEKVLLARHPKRPTSKQLINYLISDFVELHGDRNFADDLSIIGGIGTFMGQPVTVIAHEKGRTTEEKIKHNFGMPHPEGYRKALRLMQQAQKFNRPIITIIDTPGAYPGIGAEERGQAQAIANNLKQMVALTVPILVVILSEGGSGGALAIGVGDELFMFENSIYAVLSPEGFASILYKDSQKANEAADLMKLTAQDLLAFKIIDHIIPEQEGLHIDYEYGFTQLKMKLTQSLNKLNKLKSETLLEKRYEKFRRMGSYIEQGEEIYAS